MVTSKLITSTATTQSTASRSVYGVHQIECVALSRLQSVLRLVLRVRGLPSLKVMRRTIGQEMVSHALPCFECNENELN